MNKTKAVCQKNTMTMVNTLQSPGFTINYKESFLVPSQRIVFSGFLIDTIQFKIFLTEEKVQKIMLKAKHLLGKIQSYGKETGIFHKSGHKCILCCFRSTSALSKHAEE